MDEASSSREEHGRREGHVDTLLVEILKRLVIIDGKLDAEQVWRTRCEVRLAALESFKAQATWVIGTVSALIISGILVLLWALLTHTVMLVK